MIKKLSLSNFERIEKTLELKPEHVKRAKRVLVKGESVKKVAESEKITEEAIRLTIRKFVGQLREKLPLIPNKRFLKAIAQVPKMDKKNKELVRRVIVEGEKLSDVARDGGIRPATLSLKVTKVREVLVPKGYRVIHDIVPNDIADKVEKLINKEYGKR